MLVNVYMSLSVVPSVAWCNSLSHSFWAHSLYNEYKRCKKDETYIYWQTGRQKKIALCRNCVYHSSKYEHAYLRQIGQWRSIFWEIIFNSESVLTILKGSLETCSFNVVFKKKIFPHTPIVGTYIGIPVCLVRIQEVCRCLAVDY